LSLIEKSDNFAPTVEQTTLEQTTAEEEHRYQYYTGNSIPWYIRLMWLMFWVFAAVYMVKYFFPAVQREMITPP
jgi:hypothetical protein